MTGMMSLAERASLIKKALLGMKNEGNVFNIKIRTDIELAIDDLNRIIEKNCLDCLDKKNIRNLALKLGNLKYKVYAQGKMEAFHSLVFLVKKINEYKNIKKIK